VGPGRAPEQGEENALARRISGDEAASLLTQDPAAQATELASMIGNRALARLAASPRGAALAAGGRALRVLARQDTPPAPPDRDTVVSGAITAALDRYRYMKVTIPATKPGEAPASADAGAPTVLTVETPYFINKSKGDTGAEGGAHALDSAAVKKWFDALPIDARVGKGSPEQIQTAIQDAVNQGLVKPWPPTSESVKEFMEHVGLGVDCSGFIFQALKASDDALKAAGLPGATSAVVQAGSQEIGSSSGTQIKNPSDLRPGDMVQLAPNATHKVGHIRIIVSVVPAQDYVEYFAAESTTRVGSGPQLSHWRLPAGGPMDVKHLEVFDDAKSKWQPEPSGRTTTYWRRLAVPAPVTPPAGGTPAPAPEPALARWAFDDRRRRALLRAPDVQPPRAGGWNAGDLEVEGTWRVPITGLAQGLATENLDKASAEGAAHRAIAIVPRSIRPDNLEVLLHFHGNNLGERERLTPSDTGTAKGTVRDVEADLIPQQVAASGRNLIAILPQGTTGSGTLQSKFGISDPGAYVKEVLGQVVTHVNQLDATKNLTALSPVRIDVSGHSGGGPSAVGAVTALQPASLSKASDDEWVAAPPLLLFDAINGTGELDVVTTLTLSWLNDDKRRLLAHTEDEAKALLTRRGLKLRSTWSSGVYAAVNSKDPAYRTYQYGDRPAVTVDATRTLEYKLDKWFADNKDSLGATLSPILRQQYVVEHMTGAHDFTVGTGALQKGTRTAVTGVTQAPGAPAASTQAPDASQGNLAKSLSLLSPADKVVPPKAAGGPAPATGQLTMASGTTAKSPDDDDLDAGAPDPSLGGTSLPGGVLARQPKLNPDEPEPIERNFELDPSTFLRPMQAQAERELGPWVEGQWSDPDFTGEQTASVTEITKQQLYAEISKVAPHLTTALKICLVGHAWAEQQGKGVLNWNFAGVEGGSAAYVVGWTSTIIPTSAYESEPDKSKYRDWDLKGHNYRFGAIDGHHAGTIEYQLALQPKPTRLALCVRKRRPAYQSLSHAAAAFVKLIELRVETLQASIDPDHKKLAAKALAGDADAYANIVNHSFQVTDSDGKKRTFGAYNGDSGYAHLVTTQIAAAQSELGATASP
jgi:hypothetical protein